jgi:hypothetical protein
LSLSFFPVTSDANDVLHFLLAFFSVGLFVVSIGAFVRRRGSRYLFLMLAFGLLCIDQLVTLWQELYYGGFLILIPYVDLHLVHFLELLMMVSFAIALVIPAKGLKG